MPEGLHQRLARELEELREKDRFRSLRRYPKSAVDFGSNDYLGFARNAKLREAMLKAAPDVALSASSSRLLPGHHAEHLEAEECFAEFVGGESALFFNSGWDANHALLTTLPSRHDVILYDERSHASIYDGVHASLAKSFRFQHNSAEDLERKLARARSDAPNGQVFVVVESVYSMDGDVAELAALHDVVKKHGAVLIVDEAHATGVLGNRGEGLTSSVLKRDANVISMHTCGKALGAAGAFVVADVTIKEYLVNKARGFIYTTALPPIIPLQIIAALRLLEEHGAMMIERLRERSIAVREELRSKLKYWQVPDGVTPVVAVIIGRDSDALLASQALQERGFIVPAVRPPTVPEGLARLRMNISLHHSEEELTKVVSAIVQTESLMYS